MPTRAHFFLHKFQQHIGKETYRITKDKDSIVYKADFKFVDRGSPVPFKAELKVTPGLEPLEFNIKGQFSRFSTINDKIRISGGQAHVQVDDSVHDIKNTILNIPYGRVCPCYRSAGIAAILAETS